MPRIRTGYSFKTAVGSLEDVISRLEATGASRAVISDRCSTFGWTRWTKLAEKAGLSPVYGVELACVPRLGEKKPSPSYWTFLARDDIGAVHAAIAQATANFAKEPMLTYAQALSLPGLIKIADEKIRIEELPDTAGSAEDFYVALSPSTPKGLIKRVNFVGLRWIASSDNYYPTADDLEFYRVAMGRRGGTQTYPRHILSIAEWSAEMLKHDGVTHAMVGDAVKNHDAALEACTAVMRKGKLLAPPRPQTLIGMCIDGANRLDLDLFDPVYDARLHRELELIKDKGFEDYFYIVADLVAWAKKVMVVGPGRGSSAGSLVCYLLGITAIDPIPHDLLFERFIDVNRADLPDIDIDFDDTKRNLVFRYAEEKYGKERVARLGTVGFFKEKSAMNQVCAALSIPKWKAEDDRYRTLREYPEAAIVDRLEDHPSHSSQHAAGLLLTDTPVTDYVAVDSRTRAAWCDKKDAEVLNLLKIDALGLTQLSVFGRTLELIGKAGDSLWLETIPTDDPAAFAVLNRRAYSGIFQFNGNAVQGLAKGITFETLDDIVAIGALARPGPLDSGGAHLWVKRRAGAAYEPHPNPVVREITAPTQGVIVYQEQVMRIVREIGRFSWDDTSKFRRLIQYKEGLETFEEKFAHGAIESGFSPYDSQLLWDQLVTYGAYGFNKSHAVAYGLVGYWCAYMKAHYPTAFAAATLDSEPDPQKQIAILRELGNEGVGYMPIDPERSSDRWTPSEEKGILIGPLTTIKGIGPAKLQEILDARRTGAKPLRAGLKKQLENAKTSIDSLFPIRDAIRKLHPDLAAINIISDPTDINDCEPGLRGEVLVMGVVNRVAVKDENSDEAVQKRGYRLGPAVDKSLNIFIADDTGEILAKIDRRDWSTLGAPDILATAKPGKTLYAIKGTIPAGFRMVSLKRIRTLGEMT